MEYFFEQYLFRLHDAHHGEEDDGQQGSDGERNTLCAPEQCHQDDDITTSRLLKNTIVIRVKR